LERSTHDSESADARITLQDDAREHLQARSGADDATACERNSPSLLISRRRSRSQDSSRSRIPTSPYFSVRIDYRTLYIQVSESGRIGEDSTAKEGLPQKDDQEIFCQSEFP
jgi:hypothetical protein